MKLFRINKVEEFFNSYANAVELFKKAVDEFEKDKLVLQPKKIDLGIQRRFVGSPIQVILKLSYLTFQDEYEFYYYEVEE